MRQDSTTILIVEDNPADARYAREMLPSSYKFVQASSLSQALDYAQQSQIDVVLLDLSLPDSSGLETLSQLVSQRKELPIVVLTGLEDISFAIEALRVGANDYIVKARLEPDSLIRAISYAIETKKRQQTEERLLERTRLSNLTAQVGQALGQTTSLREMLVACTDAIVYNLNAAFARIWTVEEREQALILQASSGLYTNTDGSHSKIPIGKFKVGLIASEKKTHLSNSVQTDPRVSDREWANREGMVAFAGHPLLVGERLVGVMAMFSRKPLGEIALSGLSAIADQIALGIDRKNSEDARALLAAIVQSSEDGVMSVNLDGIVMSWNEAAQRIFGYSAEEMIGESSAILIPEQESEELSSALDKIRSGDHIAQQEAIRVRKDGAAINVSLTISPIRDAASGIVTGASKIVRDITDKVRHQRFSFLKSEITRILSESETFAEASPLILQQVAQTVSYQFAEAWILDHHEQVLKCVDLWVADNDTRQYNELMQLTRHVTFAPGKGLPGATFSAAKIKWIPDLSADPNFPRARVATACGLRSGVGIPLLVGAKVFGVIDFLSTRAEKPDNSLLDMLQNIGAQIGQFIERKNAEESARRSAQAQLQIGQAIMENAPIGIVWLDKNLVISEANEAFAKQFLLDAKELIGRYIFEISTGLPNQQLLDVAQRGIPFSAENFRISGQPGSTDSFYDLRIWPVNDEQHQIVGLVILTVEVTERVKLGRQREDFVATLTHDLKNPLIGQNRMLGLILEGHLGEIQQEQVEAFGLLKSGTDELLELIGTLLDVYRYEEGAPELHLKTIKAKDFINGCTAQMKSISDERNVSIKVTVVEDVQLRADQMALRRVVMNLLDNAIKFSPKGGTVEVDWNCSKNGFVLSLKDHGAGMTEAEVGSLFQRFVQTGTGRKHKAGTGLGLYLCKQIIEAHGGTISCESKVGEGTKFVVTIPF